jgi:polyphosphate kinase 2 (PPK2 family)
MLAEEGTEIVKVFLHISSDEQRDRLQRRVLDPAKSWKFHLVDLDDRALWKPFQEQYAEVIGATSTEWAPWYVVPSDRKWARNVLLAQIVVDHLTKMQPRYPAPEPGIDGIVVE